MCKVLGALQWLPPSASQDFLTRAARARDKWQCCSCGAANFDKIGGRKTNGCAGVKAAVACGGIVRAGGTKRASDPRLPVSPTFTHSCWARKESKKNGLPQSTLARCPTVPGSQPDT